MSLSQSYQLTPDPLLERDAAEPINILLVAFSYLMRRLTVCGHPRIRPLVQCTHVAYSCAPDTVWCVTSLCKRTSTPSSRTSAARSCVPTNTTRSTGARH